MYNIIPFIIILISLGVIIGILIRKFSDVKTVDVGTIKEEKEAEIKEKILVERLRRKMQTLVVKTFPFVKKTQETIKEKLNGIYKRIKELEKKYQEEDKTKGEHLSASGEVLSGVAQKIKEAKDFVNSDRMEEAEKMYIDVINVEPQNIEAYKGLFDLYYKQKEYNEAKETIKFILKLEKNAFSEKGANQSEAKKKVLADHYFDLSKVNSMQQNDQDAFKALLEAIKLDANNPKFLDAVIETSLSLKDKKSAEKFLDRLKEVNSENQKIEEFEEKIKEL